MNKRLVWNFEISSEPLLNLQDLPKSEQDEIRWEARFFWPADTIINLQGLDDSFLVLSHYKVKQRFDRYLLLPGSNYNIKLRESELLYKPLLKKAGKLQGYGKKINLADYPSDLPLPGTEHCYTASLLTQLQTKRREIEVAKEALIYRIPSEPKIKLELARLQVEKKIYFSLCIEGRSQVLVAAIAKHLIEGQVSCDYVYFLKQLVVDDE